MHTQNKRTISIQIVVNLQPPEIRRYVNEFILPQHGGRGTKQRRKVMKHLFIILSTIMVFPSLANIDASNDSPTCDESVLNASNGTANLEINWEPNVIPLRWYSGNTLLPVENNDDTCTYDGVLNRPTNPTREGYNFDGWRVRPTMDFSTLLTNERGRTSWAKGGYNCWYNPTGGGSMTIKCNAYEDFKELEKHEFKVKFDWGDIYGTGYCSAKSGNNNSYAFNNDSSNWKATYSELESASGDKVYCWCQVTGYKPSGSTILYGQASDLVWIYQEDYSSNVQFSNKPVYNCANRCATDCAYMIINKSSARRALFGL